jgi:hypothetical protein
MHRPFHSSWPSHSNNINKWQVTPSIDTSSKNFVLYFVSLTMVRWRTETCWKIKATVDIFNVSVLWWLIVWNVFEKCTDGKNTFKVMTLLLPLKTKLIFEHSYKLHTFLGFLSHMKCTAYRQLLIMLPAHIDQCLLWTTEWIQSK